uniref:DDE Tnp4 domain-containing protein n=2 Tax=Myripristis murdjan TaxID=586833 RepID=A0A667ZQ90_9TELE
MLLLMFIYHMNAARQTILHRQVWQQARDNFTLIRRNIKERRHRRKTRMANYEMLLTLHRQRARSMWVNPRPCSWWQHINTNWSDTDWQRNFRMKFETFQHLCNILRPSLTRQSTRYREPVPVELRVAICLWRLATNLEYRSISHLFGVGISTACQITQEVVTSLNRQMRDQYIKTPSEMELKAIVMGYRDKWRFPQVAGAIDGTHIGILAPADHPADYYNRKGFYSVLLQAVVDHKMKFWDINVGWPGKVHDARV